MRQQFRINFSLLASFSVVNPDPELLFRIWIQLNMKEQISKNVISLRILDFVYCRTVTQNWARNNFLALRQRQSDNATT